MKKITVSSEVLSFFTALCFLGAWAEYIFPKPLPFLRLGLANFPILIAAVLFNPKMFFTLALVKIFCQGMVAGTFFSHIFLFSLGSTLSSASITFLLATLFYPKYISFVGLSLAGALAANLVQALLAKVILGFEFSVVVLPLFALGTVTSVILGIFADFFFHRSETVAKIKTDSVKLKFSTLHSNEETKPKIFLAATGILLLAIILFTKSTMIILTVFAIALILNFTSGIKIPVKNTLVFMVFVVFFNLFSPAGKVIFTLGNFPVTQFALESGIKKALRMQEMILLSGWIFKNKAFPRGRFSRFLDEVLALANKFTAKIGAKPSKFSPAFLVKIIDETFSEQA